MNWLLILVFTLGQSVPQQPPQAEISNSRLAAVLYLPDPQSGYYRGTRFDWSGQIASLKSNGHEYFGQWFERYDPALHDAIMGPVEEFLTGDSSPGYRDAKPGEVFVRIGVGAVRRPEEPAYRRFQTYDIVNPGKWTVNKGKDWIEFVHELPDTSGYAYEYRKRVRLDGATLVLDHTLTNTGSKPMSTSVYNHNFFTIDHQPTGADFVVRFPFEPRAARPLNDLASVQGREIRFLKTFEPTQTVFTELEGFGNTAKDYGFELENRKTRAGVRVRGDRPLQKLLFWSATKTICPEPYIDASVEPGKSSTWRITYEFYQVRPRVGVGLEWVTPAPPRHSAASPGAQ